MANLVEEEAAPNGNGDAFAEQVYQIETDDQVLGGAEGVANRQGKTLAGRTLYLLKQLLLKAPLLSPAFSGEPKAPTPNTIDDSTKLATTAFVKSVLGGLTIEQSTTMILRDEKPSGVHAGSAISGVQTRELNTVHFNNIVGGVLLVDGEFQLLQGDYTIRGTVPVGNVNRSSVVLYNETDGVNENIWAGGNFASVTETYDQIQCFLPIMGRFSITDTKKFSIKQYCQTAQSNSGLGSAASLAGQIEVYTQIEITKEA